MNGYEAIKFSRETGRRVKIVGGNSWQTFRPKSSADYTADFLITIKDLDSEWEVEPELFEGWMNISKSHAFGNISFNAVVYRTKEEADTFKSDNNITIKFREVRD